MNQSRNQKIILFKSTDNTEKSSVKTAIFRKII
jgi:hypothetical protein